MRRGFRGAAPFCALRRAEYQCPAFLVSDLYLTACCLKMEGGDLDFAISGSFVAMFAAEGLMGFTAWGCQDSQQVISN